MELMDAALVLDPGRLTWIDEAAGDGNEPAGQEVQVGLPVATVHGQGAVAPNTASSMNGEGLAEHRLVESVNWPRCVLVNAGRGCADQAGVGSTMVVLVNEGPEPDVEVVERRERAHEIEASLAQSAPKALHFSACRGVVGFGVD